MDAPAAGRDTEPVLIRRERPEDVGAVRAVVAAAFADPEAPERLPVEVDLLDRLRTDPSWLPALSLVAVEAAVDGVGEDLVVGHVVCTRGAVGGAPALGLGPLAVRPDRQGHGVGGALMHAVLGAAEATGEPLVALLGEPATTTASASVPPPPTASRRRTKGGVTTSRFARSVAAPR